MVFTRKHVASVSALALGVAISLSPLMATGAGAQEKRPNVVMLMTDDTGWNDFGAYGGGANLGHPTPNIDRIAQEGRRLHKLVWSGELHRWPRLVHDRAHSHPFSALSRGRAG